MNFTKKPTDEAFSKNMYYNNFTQQKKREKITKTLNEP